MDSNHVAKKQRNNMWWLDRAVKYHMRDNVAQESTHAQPNEYIL